MFNRVAKTAQSVVNTTNNILENFTPLELITTTAGVIYVAQNPISEFTTTQLTIGATALAYGANKAYQNWDTKKIQRTLFNTGLKMATRIPYFGKKIAEPIDKELDKNFISIKIDVDKDRKQYEPVEVLQEKPLKHEEILNRFKTLQSKYQNHEGKISGAVYTKFEGEFLELLKEVWGQTALTNPMHDDWPLIKLMYAEIISMCQNLVHGESGAHGVITHGGTTSILEACLAYVMYALENGIKHPEIIVPETAHVAFDKAAKLLGVKLVKIPVGKDGKVDVNIMESKINSNTCMLVGSAPSFPFGIVDPIEKIGALGKKYNIPVHVDSCLGGFLTPFAEKAGYKIPPCDFSVPGVTSISMDTHKYGETPKGTSVLLFSKDCPATPTQAYLDWVGGMYVTDTIDGSRSGADIAVLWAALRARGTDYYVQTTADILALSAKLVEAVNKIDGLEVAYDPQLSVVGMRTTVNNDEGPNKGRKINPLIVVQELKKRGWSVSCLQTTDQKPDGFHFCLTHAHVDKKDFIEDFSNALKESVQFSKDHPDEKPDGLMKIYGSLPKIPQFLRERLAVGYAKIQNAIPGVDIPGIWKKPVTESDKTEVIKPSNVMHQKMH